MKTQAYALLCTLFCAANCFAAPLAVPDSKAAYVGTWKGADMDLTIAADGHIHYKRLTSEGAGKGKKTVDLSIELKNFSGNNFDAGYGIFQSTFVVSKPPTTEGDKTTMIVEGVELTKAE
jgi:hypothetical protein